MNQKLLKSAAVLYKAFSQDWIIKFRNVALENCEKLIQLLNR